MVKHFHVLVSGMILAVKLLDVSRLEGSCYAVINLKSNKRVTMNFIIIAFVIVERQLFPKANSIVVI